MKMKIFKKIVGLALIALCCVLVLHPAITCGITLYILLKAVELLLYWGLASLICRLLFGKSLRKWLFEEDD